jgi:K+-sensing histidine kinase KdpD
VAPRVILNLLRNGSDAMTEVELFQSFSKENGMGIGLSVSRSIIDSPQGRLSATPNDGPGVTFSFSIPCPGLTQ